MNPPHEVEILLVEDNANDAQLTLRALRKQHLANRVIWVKDGVEALDYVFGSGESAEAVPGRTPRVILLDLKLPRVDGMEVLRRLKQDPSARLIPVVVLTSSREDQDLEECYRLGVNSYIVKPVEFETFSKAVVDVGLYWLLLNEAPRVTLPPQP